MKDLSVPHSLVFDLGTANTKAGWSTNGEPDMVLPTVVGRGRHKGAMLTLGLKDSYVGRQAQNLRGILSIGQPVRNGQVENWDDLELLWSHVWEKELQIVAGNSNGAVNGKSGEPADYRVLISMPPHCTTKDRKKLGEILLEGSGVGGIYLANKSVLSMYGGGRTTGICVDSGEDMTYIVPCWEGSPIQDGTLTMKMGGRHVTDKLLSMLAQGKYSFPDDTFLLLRRAAKGGNSKGNICVASRRDVVREAKERFCKVFEKPFAAGKSPVKDEDEQVLRLPDGNIVVVGEEAFAAPEILFSKGNGLHDLVRQSVTHCNEKLRTRLVSNIMLTGGNSLLPGLATRLEKELTAALPTELASHVRVQAQAGRDNFTWDGGAHLCSLSSFQRLWVTRQDYLETGSTMLDMPKEDPRQEGESQML